MNKKISKMSILLSMSVALSIIESFIPFFTTIPGIKLGLANIIILYVLYKYTFKDALYITILRVILVGILRIGLFSITFFFSLLGAILSILAMYLFKKITNLSIIGISLIGSLFHSIGQVLVAMVFLSNINIIYYLPVLLISSVISGVIIGFISKKLLDYGEK